MNALVFNCNYNGLSVIRELGRRGVRVLALDCERSPGTVSRYARFVPCPDPAVAETAFVRRLLELAGGLEGRPVLFATNDAWAAAISRHKQRLEPHYTPCVAEWPVVSLLLDKGRFHDWAAARGYPVPASRPASEAHALGDEAFPIVAKPRCRRQAADTHHAGEGSRRLDRLRLTVLRTRRELDRFLEANAELLDQLLLQDYVEGMADCMVTVGVYADRGHEVKGLFTGRKLRGDPPDMGNCMAGQAEQVPEELKDIARRLCREVGYHGIAEFEFKRHAVTGRFHLLEVNPRSWSWVGITPACGVSLAWLAYCDLTGRGPLRPLESSVPTGSVKWVSLIADFQNCLWRYRRRGYPQWGLSLAQWWRSLRAQRLVTAEFAADDPLPGLFALYLAARAGARGLVGRLTGRR
ncbi:MAG: ATP-grasp domain-containing protein [Candidatus Brocadiia bacterium]